jgi:hypothetical protein
VSGLHRVRYRIGRILESGWRIQSYSTPKALLVAQRRASFWQRDRDGVALHRLDHAVRLGDRFPEGTCGGAEGDCAKEQRDTDGLEDEVPIPAVVDESTFRVDEVGEGVEPGDGVQPVREQGSWHRPCGQEQDREEQRERSHTATAFVSLRRDTFGSCTHQLLRVLL